MPGTKGSGGRNRKARVLHLAQGTLKPAKHAREDVAAPAGDPAVPAGLTGSALEEWHRVTARLRSQGTLSTVDDIALEQFCRLSALVVRLEEEAAALPVLTFYRTTVDGAGIEHCEPKVHPIVAQIRAGRMAVRMYLAELGLTPASRTRVTPAAGTDASADPRKAKYLNALKG